MPQGELSLKGTTNMALIVYGASLSPFVRKVRIFLQEKGLDYELEQVNPFSAPPSFAASAFRTTAPSTCSTPAP